MIATGHKAGARIIVVLVIVAGCVAQSAPSPTQCCLGATPRSDELKNRALTRIAGYGVERRERRNGGRLGAQHAPAKMDGYGAAGVRVA